MSDTLEVFGLKLSATMVEAWIQLPPPSEWRHFSTAYKKMCDSLDSAIGNFKSF